jgi:uncharacterized damage-inducible protein DinB
MAAADRPQFILVTEMEIHTMTRISAPLLAELEQEAQSTRRMLERVPDGHLSWRPHPRSMTLGELALHVATIPGALAGLLSHDTFDFEGFEYQAPELGSAADLIPELEASVAAAGEWLSSLDDEAATAFWRATEGTREIFAAPRIALVRSLIFNHWYHHRGQLAVYLRQLDVPVPAIYGPSADENPFES